MKKLMIVATAAVVACGAFALDGYNFTATMKTTKGKMQNTQTKTYNLGVDAFGNFWYDDTSITNLRATIDGVVTNIDIAAAGYAYAYFAATNNTDTKKIGSRTGVKSLKLVDKKGTVLPTGAGYLAVATPDQEALVIALAGKYSYKSAGAWCENVKIESAGCYRVAGSAKIDIALFTTNCCEIGGASFTNIMTGVNTRDYHVLVNGGPAGLVPTLTNATVTAGIWPYFSNRFGALTADKAKKVETYGSVFVPTTADGRWFSGELAGQGTAANGRVASVSGNIVGEMDPALCPQCCVVPEPAVAFDCDSVIPDAYLTTAAFGTFRFKYNSKLK